VYTAGTALRCAVNDGVLLSPFIYRSWLAELNGENSHAKVDNVREESSAGIRAALFHAMSDDAKRFYARAGFHECPIDPMMMMIKLAEVENNLGPPGAS
jgi:hypothetical protein